MVFKIIGTNAILTRHITKTLMAFGFNFNFGLDATRYNEELYEKKAKKQAERNKSDRTSGVYRSHRPSQRAMASTEPDAIPDVDIDGKGRFKYILLKLWAKDHKDEDDFRFLVRGYAWAGFHADIYDEVYEKVTRFDRLDLECVGGGRILHEPEKKKISVYGYSQGYGRAKHVIACDLLKKKYPHYHDINWSNDGY